jgi:hypothetical protein
MESVPAAWRKAMVAVFLISADIEDQWACALASSLV